MKDKNNKKNKNKNNKKDLNYAKSILARTWDWQGDGRAMLVHESTCVND